MEQQTGLTQILMILRVLCGENNENNSNFMKRIVLEVDIIQEGIVQNKKCNSSSVFETSCTV